MVAGHLQQVGADGVEPVVAGHALVGVERAEQVEPGPRAVHHRDRDGVVERDHRVGRDARRAARTGRGSAASRCPRARGASSWTAAIAACSWYGPSGACASVSVISATPSAIDVAGPSGCGPARRAGPARRRGRVRAGRRASVSSISASSPATSPSSGSSACTARVSRIASRGQLGALQVGAGGRGVALVEDQVEHVQDHAAAARRARPRAAARTRTPAGLDALLGPADALGHGRLGHQERAGDLARWSGRRRRAG